ncbi:hypothetical protein [Azonexus sp.]|uniref:hypothetical protein n=1 Tax=Azonexus sp. TaxID=1872668 RepID=UPI0035B27D02
MPGELYELTNENVSSLIHGRGIALINLFLTFCTDQGLMRPIQLAMLYNRDRTGHAQFDAKVEKLPDIESILALGSIYNTIFQPVDQNGLVADKKHVDHKNAFVITYALLGLASPNRLSAEVPVLPKQRLKAYSERGGESVYYLDWFGSKGFKDNRNHLLAALADKVDKAVNFFFNAAEPARILCRFYENPQQSLKALLADFKVMGKRKEHLKFDEPPNLFVLGYALGFYGDEERVPVLPHGVDLPDLAHNSPRYRECFESKQIYSLKNEDRLSISALQKKTKISALPTLLGLDSINRSLAHDALCRGSRDGSISVSKFQDNWIQYFKNTFIPEFPYSYSTGQSRIKLADALFCFLGCWFYSREYVGSGGKPLAGSHYTIVPLSSIGTHAAVRLSGSNQSRRNPTIFKEYGYPTLSVKPHSLRHFGNTLADLSEIPKEIITAWSGRLDKNQTNTYLHTSHEEKADRVRAVIGKPEHDAREVRVVTQEALMQGINLPATITSTGICTQELNVTPCDYLNDFISQCFMCSASCHVAGDTKAVQFFEKDHEVQLARLALVSKDRRLPSSTAMQKWFVIHSHNTHVLGSLIDFLKQYDAGSIIRYSSPTGEFHITDPVIKETKKIQCFIPDFEGKLRRLIAEQTANPTSSTNLQLQSLLSSFGLSDKAA